MLVKRPYSFAAMLLTALLLASSSVLASSNLTTNKGYTTLDDPVRPQVAEGRIEVVSIFSYTCPYCYQLDPLFASWADRQPDDVEVVHLPAAFNAQWEHLARAYYIMDALGITEKAHPALFDRMHQDKANMNSQGALRRFFADFGVSAEEFDNLYSSFGVDSRVRIDKSKLRNYRVSSVPVLVVDGQYVISGQSAGGLEAMIRVADALVKELRAKREAP